MVDIDPNTKEGAALAQTLVSISQSNTPAALAERVERAALTGYATGLRQAAKRIETRSDQTRSDLAHFLRADANAVDECGQHIIAIDIPRDIAAYAEAMLFAVTTGDERTQIATKIRNLVKGRLQGGRKSSPSCPVDGCRGRLELNPHTTEGHSYATCTVCKSTRSTMRPLRPFEVAALREIVTFPGRSIALLPFKLRSSLTELEHRQLVTIKGNPLTGAISATEAGNAELSFYPCAGVTP